MKRWAIEISVLEKCADESENTEEIKLSKHSVMACVRFGQTPAKAEHYLFVRTLQSFCSQEDSELSIRAFIMSLDSRHTIKNK